MKTLTKIIGLACLSLFTISTHAQYSATSAYETVNSTASIREDGSVGAVSNGRNTAISRQFTIPATGKCHRDLRYFDFNGNLLAQSDNYSHDHGSFTKIVFDPSDENVVYALFNQRKPHPYLPEPAIDAPRYTYLRRFVRSGTSVTMSDPYLVFANANPSNFVIAPNGDLLVGNVADDGQVNIRPIRWVGFWTAASEMEVTYPNGARRAPGAAEPSKLWPISMDMKGNTFIIGHNRGYYYNAHYIQIKKAIYNPISQTATTDYVYYINDKTLFSGSGGAVLKQAIGLKTDGSIMFISRPSYNGTAWDLNSMTAAGANTIVASGNGYYANVVVTGQNKTFFAASNLAGAFHISLYSEIAGLEHTYTPATELVNSLENLAVKGCDLLATGTLNTNYQHHQFFDCSDCDGDVNAEGHFEGQFVDRIVRSYYGNQEVAVFCSAEDVIFNGLASTCEEGYHLSVAPINIDTWIVGAPLYNDWVCTGCTAPSDIAVADYTGPLDYDQYYLMSFTVSAGGLTSTIYRLFRLEHCGKQVENTVEGKGKTTTISLTTKIYPNPSNGNFTIQTNSTALSEYEITDATGRLIQKGQFRTTSEIDVNGSPAGVYFITVSNEFGKEISKLIIK